MNLIDFLIGFTLMNAMPHFVVGVWKGRVLSGLGTSPAANIGYSMLNFSASIGLFLYQYGVGGFLEQPMYLGGLFILISWYLSGQVMYTRFNP